MMLKRNTKDEVLTCLRRLPRSADILVHFEDPFYYVQYSAPELLVKDCRGKKLLFSGTPDEFVSQNTPPYGNTTSAGRQVAGSDRTTAGAPPGQHQAQGRTTVETLALPPDGSV